MSLSAVIDAFVFLLLVALVGLNVADAWNVGDISKAFTTGFLLALVLLQASTIHKLRVLASLKDEIVAKAQDNSKDAIKVAREALDLTKSNRAAQAKGED